MTTTGVPVRPRHVLHLRFELPVGIRLADLVPLLEQVTPSVQLVEPDTALLDVTGARRYWGRDASDIARLIQLRAAALQGVRTAAATGPSRMIAAMACHLTPPGQLLTITPDNVTAFLAPRSVRELPGIGPRHARLLTEHGIDTVGRLAALPLATVQRLLGARTGLTLHDRAHGHDVRPVTAAPIARTTSAEHQFARDELDPTQHRRALLHLAGQIGTRLRSDDQVTGGLTISVRYADGSATTRTRTLDEPTHHTIHLRRAAHGIYDTLGLQRARVRSITLRAEHLRPARLASRQLAFDPATDKALAIEAVQDRARRRYGTDVIKPATLAAKTGHWGTPTRPGHPGAE